MANYGYPFPEFLQKYMSSRANTKQALYTDILVTKSVKISEGRALLFAKAINEQTPNFSFCIIISSQLTIYLVANKISKTLTLPSASKNIMH